MSASVHMPGEVSHIAIEDLIDAAGGIDALAAECAVQRRTIQGWIAGTRPSVEMRFRLGIIARSLRLLEPLSRYGSGPRVLAPEVLPRAQLDALRVRRSG